MTNNHQSIKQSSEQFLLAEYSMLRELRRDLLNVQESRLTAFMTVVGGAIAALGFFVTATVNLFVEVSKRPTSELIQSHPYFGLFTDYQYVLSYIGFALALSLLLIGWITFQRTIQRGAEFVFATRGMNRIRKCFADQDNELAKHLVYPINDNVPHFASLGFLKGWWAEAIGLPLIVAILNSLIVGLSTAIVVRLAYGSHIRVVYHGFLVSVITLAIHWVYYHLKIKSLQNKSTCRLAKELAEAITSLSKEVV